MGHERFCDAWMTSYDYEVLQDKAVFAKEIRLCVERLADNLSFSQELNEFICKCLRLRSSLRPTILELCGDVWLGDGRVPECYEPSASEKVRITANNPNRHSLYGIEDAVDNTEVDPEIIQKSFSSLSERERNLYEEHNKSLKKGDGHLLHLPPIEPATPNMQAARKILKKGEVLVQHATNDSSSSRWGGGSPLSMATDSPIAFGSGPGSPEHVSTPLSPNDRIIKLPLDHRSGYGSPGKLGPSLPLLSEAQEKEEDDGIHAQRKHLIPADSEFEGVAKDVTDAFPTRKNSGSGGSGGVGGARRMSHERVGDDERRRSSKFQAAQSAAATAAALAEQIEEDSRQAAAKEMTENGILGHQAFSPRSPRLGGNPKAEGKGAWS